VYLEQNFKTAKVTIVGFINKNNERMKKDELLLLQQG